MSDFVVASPEGFGHVLEAAEVDGLVESEPLEVAVFFGQNNRCGRFQFRQVVGDDLRTLDAVAMVRHVVAEFDVKVWDDFHLKITKLQVLKFKITSCKGQNYKL